MITIFFCNRKGTIYWISPYCRLLPNDAIFILSWSINLTFSLFLANCFFTSNKDLITFVVQDHSLMLNTYSLNRCARTVINFVSSGFGVILPVCNKVQIVLVLCAYAYINLPAFTGTVASHRLW